MNLNQLYYFKELAKERQFSKAAKNLYISQPSLSNSIKSLEKELNCQLINRNGGQITLTEYGKIFCEAAITSINSIEKSKIDIANCKRKEENIIKIASIPTAMSSYLPRIISEYKQNNKIQPKFYCYSDCSNNIYQNLEVGTQILNRSQLPFTLTEAGMIYYNYLETISYNDQQLVRKLTRYTHPNSELIRIGILESLGSFLLSELLPDFLKENPEVRIQLFESFPRINEERLLNEKIDCYIGQNPETITKGVKFYINGNEKYYVIIPSTSKYFSPNQTILSPSMYDLKTILKSPLVLSAPESAIRHQVNGLFQKFHIKPNIIMESNSIITATNLFMRGVGLTISSASILNKIHHSLPINLLPIDTQILQLQYFIAIKKNLPLSPIMKNLINAFKNLYKSKLNELLNITIPKFCINLGIVISYHSLSILFLLIYKNKSIHFSTIKKLVVAL